MTRKSISTLIIWLLAAVMSIALVLNIPDKAAIVDYGLQALVFGALTALTVYFGLLLTEGELSAVHVVGMVAFLYLPRSAQPLLTWGIFLGGVVGGIALVIRTQDVTLRRRLTTRSASSVVAISARVTLSFLVATQIYLQLGGKLPLLPPIWDDLLTLLVFVLAYCLVYFLIFVLETYSDGRSIERLVHENWKLIIAILFLPVPFWILAAVMVAIAPTALVIFAVASLLITLGTHWLSWAQYQLRRQVDELRSLAEVGGALQSNLQLNVLLQTVYNQVASLLHVDQFIVALFDEDINHVRFPLVMQNGVPVSDYHESGQKTLLYHLLETGQALLVSYDVSEATRQLVLEPPAESMQSWLGVPLLAGGKLLGAMIVTSDDPQQHFGPDDLRLLSTIAASAGVTLENARLYERQIARANQLNTLNQILALLTGTLSPEEVMDVILSSASLISEATATSLYQFVDENQQTLTLVRSAGLSDEFVSNPAMPILTDLKQPPILIDNVLKDIHAAPYRPIMGGEGKAAWAELPMIVGTTALGVLVFYYDQPQVFSEDQVEILRAFTNQAAQAIKNARLYTTTDQMLERRAEQMYALAALGRQLTATMSLRSICNLVLARALELTGSTTGFIVLKDEDELSVVAESGYPPMSLNPAYILASLTGSVLENGQVAHYHDLRVEQVAPAVMPTTRSQLTVPILRGGMTLGAITLESDYIRAFSEDDSNFVTQLANQTIIAIDNTRLFERITEARDRLQVILNAMTEAIVLVDKTGQIALANPRVDMIGLIPKDLLSQDVDLLLERPDLDLAERMGFQSDQKVRKLLKELRTPGAWVGSEPISYTVEAEHGLIYIRREVIPIRTETSEPMGMLLVFYDETEERELIQMRNDLSSMIVHDLRSPLTAVTTALKLIWDFVPDDSTFRPLVESTTQTSQRAIRKLLSRVDSLLDISKMESGQINLDTEPAELATLADNVCGELSPLAHELDVTVASKIDDEIPLFNIDADKVERVLQNLVDNALKFCPSHGSVTIQAYQPGTNGAEEGFARIDVVDTGPGVPDEYKSRLFERFVQVKGRRGARRGIGLGLTFCRLVTEAHGGRIWIEDNPAGGSIFAFTLPVLKEPDRTDEIEIPKEPSE